MHIDPNVKNEYFKILTKCIKILYNFDIYMSIVLMLNVSFVTCKNR